MRTHRSYWPICIAMLGLMLLLAACGGGGATSSTTGANSTGTPHATSTTPSSGSINTTSTVSFTASGGLTGTYTISENTAGSNYSKSALAFVVSDQSWLFTLQYSGYKGPGTYTFKYNRASPPWGRIGLASSDGTKSWALTFSTSCQLTVTSDTSLDSQYHEVKGSFFCPSLASQSSSSIMLTNGQLDIVALVVSR
ncbi:MAG: hypothetical protein NVSMB27_29620 [Ktedonobacteraceae bacterium]